MSDFNNKLVVDLFEERDALKADVVRLTLKVAELYKGAEEQKQRIQSLIEERDRANRLAEWKWNLRDEFQLLLGTDKIEEGIESVKELKQRIKRLEEAGWQLLERCEAERWIPANTKPEGCERRVLLWIVWPQMRGWCDSPEPLIGWWKHGPKCFALGDIENADHLVRYWMEIPDPTEAKEVKP